MYTIKYKKQESIDLTCNHTHKLTDNVLVINESGVTKIAPQTRAAPLAIRVQGLAIFQEHNLFFLFQPYAEWSSHQCQAFVPTTSLLLPFSTHARKPPTADT